MPSKLFQFWQELKRRNVIRVITVYAGAAFVLLELVDMITEPFGLPAWTFKLAVVILSIGFVVAIILSWIYDIQPERGIVKTEPANNLIQEQAPKSSNSWKIASYISFVVIVILVVLNIIPRDDGSTTEDLLEKSIAVLPFNYYDMNPEAEDIGDAFANEIITQLYKIKGFDRIISHTSTLQYKGSNKPSMTTIGKELGANYIIEGSLERQNDDVFRLPVNLDVFFQMIRIESGMHTGYQETKRWPITILTNRLNILKI